MVNYYRSGRTVLFSTASALALVLSPSPARAQEETTPSESSPAPQEAQAGSVIGDIIVTARRRNESLQEVPLAVSVLTSDELKTQLVTDQNDLQQKVPSLSVASRFGHTGGTYAIRGLSGTNTGTPAVGTYFAEVPTPTNNIGVDTSAGTSLYDLASVQVLKGPQGTLFGRSTTAGAVLVTPAAPNLQVVEANGSLSLGNMGYSQGILAVSVPIVEDMLAVRVAGNFNHRRGYTKIIGTDERLDGLDNDSQRVSVLFKPFDWLKNTTIYDRFHADQSSSAYIAVAYNPDLPLFNLTPDTAAAIFTNSDPQLDLCGAVVAFGLSPSAEACIQERLDVLAAIRSGLAAETERTEAGGDALRRTASGNSTAFIDRHTHETVVNTTEITLPPLGPLELQLKNIFGYQTTKGVTGVNIAGIPQDLEILYVGVGAGAALNQSGTQPVISLGKGNKFYSNETQLSGTLYGDRLVFVAGYYYQHAPSRPDLENLGSIQKVFGGITTLNLGYSATGPFTVGGRANQNAFYGQATLSLDGLLDGVKVTAGVRHTKDDFLLRTAAASTNPVTGVMTPAVDAGGNLVVQTQALKTSGTNYNFSIDYKATPTLLLYAATRKGYVPGGLNNSNAAGAPGFKLQFDPETIKDVEAGFKWDFNLAGTRGRLNMAAYEARYSGIQRPLNTIVNGAAVAFISNVAKAKLRGLEAELTVLPTDMLTLGFNYSLNDTKYTSWTGADPYGGATDNIDLADSPFENAPKHKFNLSAAYAVPLAGDNGTVTITGQYTYQSRTYYLSAANRYLDLYPGTDRDDVSQKGFGIANARIDWRDPLGHQGVTASLFARNIFDKIYGTSATALNNALGVTSKQFGEPRIVGASLSFTY